MRSPSVRAIGTLSVAFAFAFASNVALVGCARENERTEKLVPDPRPPPVASTVTTTTPPTPGSSPMPLASAPPADASREGLRFVTPPDDLELSAFLRSERLKQKAQGRLLVVYVGAPWCPPCKRFHAAASEGRLDAQSGRLTLVALDADRDTERLASLGYVFKNIPYFAIVGQSGRPTESHAVIDVKASAQDEIATTLSGWQRAHLPTIAP